MGGHSHWAGIKHKKALLDSKRGKIFTRLIREITIAARIGGGNPDHNPRLRKAIEDANAANMPKDNVKRGIQRGTGELPGTTYEEVTYEGYGPGGVAVLVDVTTDSRNRTLSEIRRIFEDHGGNLGSEGCVGWMFQPKGVLSVPRSALSEDDLLGLVMEAGAEDLKADKDGFTISTAPRDFEAVKAKLASAGVPSTRAELTRVPTSEVGVSEKDARKVLDLLDTLESHDDVKNVVSNFNIPDEVLAKLES